MRASRRGPHRLPKGGIIDRSQPVRFAFNGTQLSGFAGDSLAAALLASGVRVVSRSFKFHRPRGIFSCGVEETGGILRIGDGAASIPSTRATRVELTQGLNASSQRGWPSVQWDVGRVLDALAPLWSAGFYNKTFLWPGWHVYEPIIRGLAGLGVTPPAPDPDRYDRGSLHCDVLVVGGGRSGLQAAIDAGRSGARVVLVEQDRHLGGHAAWSGGNVDDLVRQLDALPEVQVLSGTTATGCYDHGVVALVEARAPDRPGTPRERYWTVRAGRIVLATGAIEQPLIFQNNDRPGVMLAGAARQYLLRYGVAIGSRVLIATNNDSAYTLALDLRRAEVDVVAVVDSREQVIGALPEAVREAGIEILRGALPCDTSGGKGIRSVTVSSFAAGSPVRTLECDALAVSGGFSPALHLFAQAGGKLSYDEMSGALLPDRKLAGVEIVGAASRVIPAGLRISPFGNVHRCWVDLLNDVTLGDLQLALRENYRSVEHVKRYTTAGMGIDQGKTSGPIVLDALGKLQGVAARELGHTTFRPPFTPVTLGAIAGREVGALFAPYRTSPLHDWHESHRATLQDFGEWRRACVYPREGESRAQAARREAHAVRTAAGLFDGSPLGKIEIHGPDALDFADRFYVNDLTSLPLLRARYGLMLRETGTLFDDGTVARLGPERVVITTTSGNATVVYRCLEEWRQCEWPAMRVSIVPVTECWATVTLTGPKARGILARLSPEVDLSPAAFPHLDVRECRIAGLDARLYRVSYTGELSFEINVPADHGPALWEMLMRAGADDGLVPVGVDALLHLRLEKGFLHVGTDTDGSTVPADVGWGRVAATKTGDFVGKRSLRLPELSKPDRHQLVGLRGLSGGEIIVGSHLRLLDSRHPTDGWVTSAGTTVLTREHIALAMIRGGRQKMGADVQLIDDGKNVGTARIVAPPFYDKPGERLHG